MIVESDLKVKGSELSEKEWERLLSKLIFTDNSNQRVKAYRILRGGTVRLPRGAWNLLPDHIRYRDQRVAPAGRKLKFDIVLDASGFTGQRRALDAALEDEQGLVVAQPGFGKTQVALALAATVRTPTIVLVHTEDIFQQWMSYAKNAIPGAKIGHIQGEDWKIGDITIAMVPTLHRDIERFRSIAARFGLVVIDECHHAPAGMWMAIINSCPAKYRIGFTATETRADGLHPLMKVLIGPVLHKQPFVAKMPVTVRPLKSPMKFRYRGRYDWQPLLNELVEHDGRNRLIAETIARQYKKGHSVLALSRRVEHLRQIEKHLAVVLDGDMDRVEVMTGSLKRPKRLALVEGLRDRSIRVVLATQLADEALDVPALDRIILTFPGKHDGKIIQQVGRGLREHPDKMDCVVYDVVDEKVNALWKHWRQRKKTYEKLGLNVKHMEGESMIVSVTTKIKSGLGLAIVKRR